jgi:hypothetical protein
MRSTLLLVGLALGGAACHGRLLSGNAYDRPLISFPGLIRPANALPSSSLAFNPSVPCVPASDGGSSQPPNPIMGLLWTDPLQRIADVPAPARWVASSMSITDDTRFQLDVFRPPPAEAMVDAPLPDGSATLRMALAEIVMIDDQNCDGTFAVQGPTAEILEPDQYLGAADSVLVYLDRSYGSLPSNPLVVTGNAGYQLVYYVCNQQQIQNLATPYPFGPSGAVVAVVQPSRTFPEVRTCARTHSP